MAIVALCGDRGLRGKASIGEGRVGWQCVLERVKVGGCRLSLRWRGGCGVDGMHVVLGVLVL